MQKALYMTYRAVKPFISLYGAGQSGLSFFGLIFVEETLHIVDRLTFYFDLVGDDYSARGHGRTGLWIIESCHGGARGGWGLGFWCRTDNLSNIRTPRHDQTRWLAGFRNADCVVKQSRFIK
jgi:hypothetical protein